MVAVVVAPGRGSVTLAMPLRLRPNTFMVANVTLSASARGRHRVHHRLDARHAADVLVGLGLQLRVGVVVAAERDAHGDHRRDVGLEQRRGRQRLPVDVVGGDRVQRRAELLGQLRTCVWLVASASRNCFWTCVRPSWPAAFSAFSDWSRSARSDTSGSRPDPVSSCLSCVGEIDGSVRPAKLTSSLALPRAPIAIGSACTVPKQVARCLA